MYRCVDLRTGVQSLRRGGIQSPLPTPTGVPGGWEFLVWVVGTESGPFELLTTEPSCQTHDHKSLKIAHVGSRIPVFSMNAI